MSLEEILKGLERKLNDQIDDTLHSSDTDFERSNALVRSIVAGCQRMEECVMAEMLKFATAEEWGSTSSIVKSALSLLMSQCLPEFIEAFRVPSSPIKYAEVSERLRNCVRNVCKTVAQIDFEQVSGRPLYAANLSAGQHIDVNRDVMRKLPQSEIEQIERHCQQLHRQKRVFDREVLKWDEKGNDIVLLAKQMCLIMMDMSDFTRGKGPLRSTMDVICAAKQISQFGTKLDRLARTVAIECVQSQSKQDLLAYLDRVSLFTHQLNITSRVKADVQNISGELVVSGLDSATSLIMSAKNLMNSVILVVKASYIASTKYPAKNGSKQSNHQPTSPENSNKSSTNDVSKISWNVVKE